MKYFGPGDILLSDFDGVFLDSQKEFLKVMKDETSHSLWEEYLRSINWKEFLDKCEEVPNATKTFLELQKLNILKGFITKIHSFEEGNQKKNQIRKRGLIVPIYYVLSDKQDKSDVYIPNKNTVLLDDKYSNAFDWENKGGRAIIYDPEDNQGCITLIKSIDELLK